MNAVVPTLDRQLFIDRYVRTRQRTAELFDLLTEEAYYATGIPLRHPSVFYEGHLPAFSFNTLLKRALGQPSIDAHLESLFARGIDPHESQRDVRRAPAWPDRATVRAFGAEVDRRVLAALADADLDRPGDPLLDRAEAVFAILEHEVMHQETLLYIFHRLPHHQKHRPDGYQPTTSGALPAAEWMEIPPGRVILGRDRDEQAFGWDNERPRCVADVEAFAIQRHDVSNAAFLEFVDAGGYEAPQWWTPEDWQWLQSEQRAHPLFWERAGQKWTWRGQFEPIPLPPAWPVYVSYAEASAYLRWRGWRLPTEAEFQRATYGAPEGPERRHPWGDADATARHGCFDFAAWDPIPCGSHPAGASAWGVEDLVGNGWEWTSTVFGPFPGFVPLPSYPEYSADFFDGEHLVLKGASPVTGRELIRPTFRNWFRGRYPYAYASFRGVRR